MKKVTSMIHSKELLEKFCKAGALSVRRYYDVSGEGPWRMPEYFMSSFIVNHLGDQITSTLETNVRTLLEWNAEIRKRQNLPILQHDNATLQLAQKLSSRRVDMVLYEGEEENKPKNLQDIYALVEFKGGWMDTAIIPGKISDRDKLLMLLLISTLVHGASCVVGSQKIIRNGKKPQSKRQKINGSKKQSNYLILQKARFSSAPGFSKMARIQNA